jgi:hypothetical protein
MDRCAEAPQYFADMVLDIPYEYWIILSGALIMMALVSVVPYCTRVVGLCLSYLYNWGKLYMANKYRFKRLDGVDPSPEDDTINKLPLLSVSFVTVGEEVIKVMVDSEGKIAGRPVGGLDGVSTVNEMAMPYSKVCKIKSMPKGMVKFYDPNQNPIGCGVRIEDKVLTVSHVANIASFAGTDSNSLVKVVNVRSADPLDFAIVELEKGAWSFLGVKAAKLGRPKLGQGVVVYGQKDDSNYSSVGVITERTDEPFIVAHNASTTRGWSGGPMYSNNRVVALHVGSRVGSDKVHNRALVLFPFVEHLVEESDDDKSNYVYNLTEFDLIRKNKKSKINRLDFMGRTYLTAGGSYTSMKVDEFLELKEARGEDLWEDIEDDDIEPPPVHYKFEEADKTGMDFGDSSSMDSRLKQQLGSSQRVTLSQIMREPSASSKPIMREAVIRSHTQTVMSKEQSKLAQPEAKQIDSLSDVKSTLKELVKSVQSLKTSAGQDKVLSKPNMPSASNSQAKGVPSQKSKRKRSKGGAKKL